MMPEESKRKLSDVNDKETFKDVLGNEIKNLEELISRLNAMKEEEFRHHVNESKNDYANWIRHVIKDEILAVELDKTQDKDASIKAIEDRVNELKKRIHMGNIIKKINLLNLVRSKKKENVEAGMPAPIENGNSNKTEHIDLGENQGNTMPSQAVQAGPDRSAEQALPNDTDSTNNTGPASPNVDSIQNASSAAAGTEQPLFPSVSNIEMSKDIPDTPTATQTIKETAEKQAMQAPSNTAENAPAEPISQQPDDGFSMPSTTNNKSMDEPLFPVMDKTDTEKKDIQDKENPDIPPPPPELDSHDIPENKTDINSLLEATEKHLSIESDIPPMPTAPSPSPTEEKIQDKAKKKKGLFGKMFGK